MEIIVNCTELGMELVHRTLFKINNINNAVPHFSEGLVYLQMYFTCTGHFNKDFKGVLLSCSASILGCFWRSIQLLCFTVK